MPEISEKKSLQSFLEDLIASYETEVNYAPLEIELDSQKISPEDITSLLIFIKEKRKRLFIFKIPGDEYTSNKLALIARQSVLNKTAEAILQNTSKEPKIYPLKKALSATSSVRARIQIQKSFVLPTLPTAPKNTFREQIEHITEADLNLEPLNLPDFPALTKQFQALGIEYLQDTAVLKIKEHAYAFKDGIVPNNLPRGFYINKEKQAFCYLDTSKNLPSALAPVLKKQELLTLPSIALIKTLLPTDVSQNTITLLTEANYSLAQKNALIGLLSTHSDEIKTLLQLLKPGMTEFIIPLLCKQFILGGKAHTVLFVRLLNNCLYKKISLDFLKTPEVQNSFLDIRGMKNLQKLIQLSAEEKEWWSTLINAHLNYDQKSLDFNTFFEAYTQVFLPRIAEKKLTLPHPCPIKHNGHLLITLNRVLDVIEQAQNPQEQCMSLANLNWGATGVHYAMVQKSKTESLKQAAACMDIKNPEDMITDPDPIYQELENKDCKLKPWMFRYIGQHWNTNIKLSDIEAQLLEIEKLIAWTPVQKNQLLFILTCTFSDKAALTTEQWKKTLSSCISSLQLLEQNDRSDLLQALSRCFKFKPGSSLTQIDTLIKQCIDLKTALPDKKFKNELLAPLISCLENEGFELLNILYERIQKTEVSPERNHFSASVITSFTTILQNNRQNFPINFSKLLAKINEPDLTVPQINLIESALQTLQTKKGNDFNNLVLSVLSQINIAKSQSLPNIELIQTLLNTLANLPDTIPIEFKTPEKQEAWLNQLIMGKNLLPGCTLGNGDLSKLDNLIVDALVDAVKKRSAAFKIDILKANLQKNLQNFIVPQQLRDQLNAELMPLLDTINELVVLLQKPNPQFAEVIERLQYFEEKKPELLEKMYGVGLLGKTKGEYILSFLLTGKRKIITDATGKKIPEEVTGAAFAGILGQLHGLFLSEMNTFFNNPQNKLTVKDFDLNISLAWMATFNETHSLTFFFKEELVQKKVLPALKKTLQQLNTQDPEFEKSICDEAQILIENKPSDQALQDYKNKIESIANYLNVLIDIKELHPDQFNQIYKQLNTTPLNRLNFDQKRILIHELINKKPGELHLYLKLTVQSLQENSNADSIAIGRAIHGLIALFNLSDLEPEIQVLFFKMSMAHNLNSPSPFPLDALNNLQKSSLSEATKSLITKHIIQILIGLSGTDSVKLITALVSQTQLFLTENQEQSALCIALLRQVSQKNLSAYPLILQQLATISPENRETIALILTNLVNNKKDDTLSLYALPKITKALGRLSSADMDQVLQLFVIPPYPSLQSLNSVLLADDSDKLRTFCLNFDLNPFAKTDEKRDFAKQFSTERVQEALANLQDLIHEVDLPYSLQVKLAKQLTFIEILGYTDPLNPHDFSEPKKLSAYSRQYLKEQAKNVLEQLRSKSVANEKIEVTQLELLAYLREIYFRTTGLFPNTTQMLVLLLAMHDPSSNLLMRIKTGEGKSINAPMLSVLQWIQGGTVDQCTENSTLLKRDFDNNSEPFFTFLGIETALIHSDSPPEAYKLNGINCSTVEDMSNFRLAAKEAKKEALLENGAPIHIVLDECDGVLLDQATLYKLVAEKNLSANTENNPEQWIYPLTNQFIKLPAFRNTDPAQGKIWDEEEDLEQFRAFLNKEINEQFSNDIENKECLQNFLMASSNTQLKQWLYASCVAATLLENKHFIVQPLKEKNEAGHKVIKKMVCVPLFRSTPKTGAIFTEGVQQALQARLKAECTDQAQYFFIDPVPSVLASQSAHGLIKFYQNTQGRLIGISATPGDKLELESLATSLGTQAISIAPHAGDKRNNHPPIFTHSSEETIQAIHKTIDKIKLPITRPTMELDPDTALQAYEEPEDSIEQKKRAIEQWSHTQTQPILIVAEDFNEAQKLGDSLEIYKKQKFKIQIVTGKESPDELDQIIKRAGQVNTITLGTPMLAKGIDIHTGDHPRGLFVIQTYLDTKRMTTQIAGRAARNGKPGEWLPIYQVKPLQLVDKCLSYLFPQHYQRINENTVGILQNEIKQQATIDRLYTQAIDEVQQLMMQQIEAWEGLLLELYPADSKLQFEFYQWREAILGELTRSQEANISKDTLNASINLFKNLACKLWDTAREEKWAARAEKATNISIEQNLRLKYLKQVELSQELNIQAALQQKSRSFVTGKKALMDQNLETIIMDKAGIFLDYVKPEGAQKTDLELAQNKQLLPKLIGTFCAVYPEAIQTLVPKKSTKNPFYLPEIVIILIKKLIEQKNRVLHYDEQQQVSQSIIQYYQNILADADSSKIQELLTRIKPLLLEHKKSLTKASLAEQFKIQGLISTFSTLYQNSGLPEDAQLNELKTRYDDKIMKELARYLLEQLAWVKEKPTPLHALFERTVAKEAAIAIYTLAEKLVKSPQNEKHIQALYAALQKHRIILQDKYLFSISHLSPRSVINNALDAIDALNHAPHCDLEFRNNCRDQVISEHHLMQFRSYLTNTSPHFFTTHDPVWGHLKKVLLKISQQNQSHVLQELDEAIKRFSTYKAYQPYLGQLQALHKKIQKLHEVNALKQDDAHENLLRQKAPQLAHLLQVNPDQVRIQNGSDGISSYIEVQIKDAPLKEGFTGHQSAFLPRIEAEKAELKRMKSAFEAKQNVLQELSDENALEILPMTKRAPFAKLFRLKTLLTQDWPSNLTYADLPEFIQNKLQQIDELKTSPWTKQQIEQQQALFNEGDKNVLKLIETQAEIEKKLEGIDQKIEKIKNLIDEKKAEIEKIENLIATSQERRKQTDCGIIESAFLWHQISENQDKIQALKKEGNQLAEVLDNTNRESVECNKKASEINEKKAAIIAKLIEKTKCELASYLQNTSKQLVAQIQQEFQEIKPAMKKIQKDELKKATYQTRRFFKPSELLSYEAELLKEEKQIPKKNNPLKSSIPETESELPNNAVTI